MHRQALVHLSKAAASKDAPMSQSSIEDDADAAHCFDCQKSDLAPSNPPITACCRRSVWWSMPFKSLAKHLGGALTPHAAAQGLTGAGRRQGWATAWAHARGPPTAASMAPPATTSGRPCSRRAQSSW